jgi:hypothetical protein
MSEDELQKAVARLLDHSGLLWCHVPNKCVSSTHGNTNLFCVQGSEART